MERWKGWYYVGGKLLTDIKSMYVNSLTYIGVIGSDSVCFSINSGVRQGCIMSLWYIWMQ